MGRALVGFNPLSLNPTSGQAHPFDASTGIRLRTSDYPTAAPNFSPEIYLTIDINRVLIGRFGDDSDGDLEEGLFDTLHKAGLPE
jgi:hypothetical protein